VGWLISVGDAFSQLVGRLIPVRVNGKWQAYTRSPNESISGASRFYELEGHFSWPRKSIDAVAKVLGDDDHCQKALMYDYWRSVEYQSAVERVAPHVAMDSFWAYRRGQI